MAMIKQESNTSKYLALLAYCSLSQKYPKKHRFANVQAYANYSPIWTQVMNYYSISSVDLMWASDMYYFAYYIFAPISIYYLKIQFNVCMCISALLTFIGSLIVYMSGQQFKYAIIGYVLYGISQAIFFTVTVYIAEIYFNVYSRTLMCSIASFANYTGSAFAYTLYSFYFYNIQDEQKINDNISYFNMLIVILNAIAAALVLVFTTKVKASQFEVQSFDPIFKQICSILNNEGQLLSLCAFSTQIGIGWIYMTLISTQMYLYNFDIIQISVIGVAFQITGIIFGIAAAYWLDKQTKNGIYADYDQFIILYSSLGFICLLFETLFMQYCSYWALVILNCFIGIGLNSLYPIQAQALCETLFQASSLVVVFLMNAIANTVAVVLAYICIIPQLTPYTLWLGLILITPFYLYIIMFHKTKHTRFEI